MNSIISLDTLLVKTYETQGLGIIEYGSNANGYYAKYAEGTMMQWGHKVYFVANQSVYLYTNSGEGHVHSLGLGSGSYPTPFLTGTVPIFTARVSASGSGGYWYGQGSDAQYTNSVFNGYLWSYAPSQVGAPIGLDWIAIGRWIA